MNLKQGSRYLDIYNVLHVIVYSKPYMIRMMPIVDNAIAITWNKDEFLFQVKTLKYVYLPTPKINRDNVSEYLFEFQLNLIGKTMADILKEDDWKNLWKLTKREKEIFESCAIAVLKKVYRFNTSKARKSLGFFETEFGLLTFE